MQVHSDEEGSGRPSRDSRFFLSLSPSMIADLQADDEHHVTLDVLVVSH